MNGFGSGKASFNFIVNFGRTLTQVGPLFWMLDETMFGSLVCAPKSL